MTFVLHHLFFMVPALLLLGVGAATAEWRPAQRTVFMNDCVPACRENPNIKADQKDLCAAACGCVMSEGEKFMTPADFDAGTAAMNQGNGTDKTKRLMGTVMPACSRRTFTP